VSTNLKDISEYNPPFHQGIDDLKVLRSQLEQRFEAWEEERARQVVYRVNGFQKFMKRIGDERGMGSFPEVLARESDSFTLYLDSGEEIPCARPPDRGRSIRGQKDDKKITGHFLAHHPAPLRAGWWMRLAYLKSEQSSSPFTKHALNAFALKWTQVMCLLIKDTLLSTTTGQGQQRRGIGGVDDEERHFISPRQLTARNHIELSKLEQFEYLWDMARVHFESGLLNRRGFLQIMVFKVMKNMHNTISATFRGPLPLCSCYFFIRKLLWFLPLMDESTMQEFWKLSVKNSHLLSWSKIEFTHKVKGASALPRNLLVEDVAFEPLMDLFRQGLKFIKRVVPKKTMIVWEKELRETQGFYSLTALNSMTFNPWGRVKELGKKDGKVSSLQNAGNSSSSSSTAATAAAITTATTAEKRDSLKCLPVCDSKGNFTTEKRWEVSSAPVGAGDVSSFISNDAGFVELDFSVIKERRKEIKEEEKDTKGIGARKHPWMKFEYVSDTPSIHYLLRNAKKIRK